MATLKRSDVAIDGAHDGRRKTDAEVLRLADFLPYRLSVLSNRVSNAIAQAYSERFNLTIPQWRVIAVLAEHGTLTSKEIVATTAMDKVTVSRAVAGLVQRGDVGRTICASDGRARHLNLTASGRSIHAQIAPVAKNFERTLTSTLSAEERRQLMSLLSRLTDAATQLL